MSDMSYSDSITISLRSGRRSNSDICRPRALMALIISLHFSGDGVAAPRLILAIMFDWGLYPTSDAISSGRLSFIKVGYISLSEKSSKMFPDFYEVGRKNFAQIKFG